jgi:hypothetical protein
MKKVLFIAAVAVASLASCKKDRVCTCTTTSSSGTTTTATTYFKAMKGDARLLCEQQSTQTVTTQGSVSVTGDKTTCTLK